MPHFSITQRITTGGRLGHDRIDLLCYEEEEEEETLFVNDIVTVGAV